MENNIKENNHMELGTFSFLQLGWWVWHIIAIVGVFYLGHIFGSSVFR